MTWVCQNVRGDPRGTPTKLYGHISKTVDFAPKSLYYAKVKEALLRIQFQAILGTSIFWPYVAFGKNFKRWAQKCVWR